VFLRFQISFTGGVKLANIGGTQIIDAVAGTTVTITIDATIPHTVARWTAAQTTTINISGTPVDGQELTLIVLNDGVLPRVLTLGTGLVGMGIITGVLSKRSVILFVASGGVFYEVTRSVGL